MLAENESCLVFGRVWNSLSGSNVYNVDKRWVPSAARLVALVRIGAHKAVKRVHVQNSAPSYRIGSIAKIDAERAGPAWTVGSQAP